MLSQVIAKARSRDEKLKAAKEKAAKIKHQNEKLNAVLDLEKPSALTEEECELLIQYLLAENSVVLEEYRICYMRGLMDGMENLHSRLVLQKSGGYIYHGKVEKDIVL